MRQELYCEIKKENPNSAALGAYNANLSIVGGSYNWTTNKSENARILAGIAEKEGYKVEIKAFGSGNSSIAMASNGKIYINKTSKILTDPTKNMDAQYKSGWLSTNKPEGIIHHEIAHLKFKQRDNFFTNSHRDIVQQVSRYARQNPKEFISETYAGIKTGKIYSKEVMNLYELYKN